MRDIIDSLTKILFTNPQYVTNARNYVQKRGLNMKGFCSLWAATDDMQWPFYEFADVYHPAVFTNCLFMPVMELENPNKVVGFDIRYIGDDPNRLRFVKMKRGSTSLMFFSSVGIDAIDIDAPLIVTESIMDAESVRAVSGLQVISPLTALANLRFMLFLTAISKNVYIMYDNDSDGQKSSKKIMTIAETSGKLKGIFKTISYSGKDANSVLTDLGPDYLRSILKVQVK